MGRPVLLLDVDGPLNPDAVKPHRRPEGYGTHRLMTPRWEAAERRRLAWWGTPHKAPKPLRVWLNPAHGPALTALPYDLVWATTWEEEANAYIAPLLGLPELPFIAWSEPRPVPSYTTGCTGPAGVWLVVLGLFVEEPPIFGFIVFGPFVEEPPIFGFVVFGPFVEEPPIFGFVVFGLVAHEPQLGDGFSVGAG
ncbi:hypothetical protein [Kitasatospora sp. NPDC017646]|uniref:hypothetical protein n=1 Tax=Kitasatospora sp. NPDC017646 TaxID=3364024 RepID=UPI0037B298D3